MKRLHARYPFLDASRDAVEAADVDLGSVVAEEGPAVRRGRERLKRALLEGTVEPDGPTPAVRTELLSYPIARILVSLLDVPGATQKYAAAEAAVARERFERDFKQEMSLKSDRQDRLTLDMLLSEFGLSAVQPTGEGSFSVGVTDYLRLAAELDDDRFRLVNRPLDAGTLPVTRPELYTLLREAIARRVRTGLPISVPDPLAEQLAEELDVIRGAIADLDPPTAFDVVSPPQFPPCMRALLSRVRSGETLPDHSRFSLASFLACSGLEAAEAVELCGLSGAAAEDFAAQMRRLTDESGPVTTPPSCATMVEYGDCIEPDDLCETIDHPLSYYEKRLSRTPDGQVTEWREEAIE
ncbi:MAG: DNA primase large subunit PriL [Natronomonas sp.]